MVVDTINDGDGITPTIINTMDNQIDANKANAEHAVQANNKQQLEILVLQQNASMAPATMSGIEADMFTDSNGYRGTIDTGNTTAAYDPFQDAYISAKENSASGYQLLHLNETSGTTATDSSGNARNGTASNSGIWDSSNKLLGAAGLGNNPYYVDLGYDLNAIGTSATIEFWAKQVTPGDRDWMGGGNSATPTAGLKLQTVSTGQLTLKIDSNAARCQYNVNSITNEWFHLAFSYHSTNGTKMFINGLQVDSDATGVSPSSSVNCLIKGYNNNGAKHGTSGLLIDEFLIRSGEHTTFPTLGSVMVQTNTIAASNPTNITDTQLAINTTTVGSPPTPTYDMSSDNGSNYDTAQALDTKNTITTQGANLKIKINIDGNSAGLVRLQRYAVSYWD